MFTKTMTYVDFDDQTVTETFYFNISKPELIELDVQGNGLADMFTRIIKNDNKARMIEEMKRLILLCYGKKSEDGRRFIKSEELREEFSQTQAYADLFMELANDNNAAWAFISGAFPRDMVQDVTQQDAIQKAMEVLPQSANAPKAPVPFAAPPRGVV